MHPKEEWNFHSSFLFFVRWRCFLQVYEIALQVFKLAFFKSLHNFYLVIDSTRLICDSCNRCLG